MADKLNALQIAAACVFGMVAEYETDADSLTEAVVNGWLIPGGCATYDLTVAGLIEAQSRNYEIGVIVRLVMELEA